MVNCVVVFEVTPESLLSPNSVLFTHGQPGVTSTPTPRLDFGYQTIEPNEDSYMNVRLNHNNNTPDSNRQLIMPGVGKYLLVSSIYRIPTGSYFASQHFQNLDGSGYQMTLKDILPDNDGDVGQDFLNFCFIGGRDGVINADGSMDNPSGFNISYVKYCYGQIYYNQFIELTKQMVTAYV